MGQRVVRQVNQPRGRQALSSILVVGVGIILLFAVVGVVSAGSFVAGKMSGSTTQAKTVSSRPGSNLLAAQEIGRAHAQATAIVRNAQAQSRSLMTTAMTRANRQASAIVAAARRKAAAMSKSAASSHAVASTGSGSTSSPASVSQPSASGSGASAGSGTTGYGSSSSGTSGSGYTGATNTSGASGSSYTGTTNTSGTSGSNSASAPQGTLSGGAPDLSSVPSSWRVVAYNASFGSGPGSAGGITVTNRGSGTFSGVAKVVYVQGGSASASFGGLAAGQTLTLPLNGRTYPGGGYQIYVNVR